MPFVPHAHLSGRYDATPDQWANALNYLACKARVITLTEARNVRAVRDWAKGNGWLIAQPRGAECAILFKPLEEYPAGRNPIREEGAGPLTGMRLPSGRAIVATWAKIDLHPRFRPVTFVAFHLPAHLEGANGFKRGKHYATHQSAVKGLKRLGAEANRRVVLVGDVNLNLRRTWVRRWAAVVFRRYSNAWQTPLPKAGTHGPRLIDWHLSKSGIKCGPAKPLKKLPGFDHRPFVVSIEL